MYGSPGGTFLLITYHLLLTTYYLSLITYYLSLITYYLLLITYHIIYKPGRVAQSVTCLATDASLIADPGVANLIPAQSYTFVEIDFFLWPFSSLPLNHSRRVVVSYKRKNRERSGAVVECLTRDRRAAGSSLTGVTAL